VLHLCDGEIEAFVIRAAPAPGHDAHPILEQEAPCLTNR
jgi:hypothetical protein